MEKITYKVRAKGGYYADTDKGRIIVEKMYLPMGTPVWIASHRGTADSGITRNEAVTNVYNKLK